VDNIYDGDTSDTYAARWRNAVATDGSVAELQWIGLDLGTARPVSMISFISGFASDSANKHCPTSVYVEYSTDGAAWTADGAARSVFALAGSGTFGWQELYVSATTSARYWRLRAKAATTAWYVTEMTAAYLGQFLAPAGAVASSDRNLEEPSDPQSMYNAFDGDATNTFAARWRSTAATDGSVAELQWIGPDLGSAMDVSFLRLLLGFSTDTGAQSPASVYVEHSSDGASWTLESTVSTNTGAGSFAWKEISVASTALLARYWRLRAKEPAGHTAWCVTEPQAYYSGPTLEERVATPEADKTALKARGGARGAALGGGALTRPEGGALWTLRPHGGGGARSE